MASAEAAAPSPAAMQTIVLRVSIHCLGCKKKVRKVLRGVAGVQNVLVDAAQHRVTVTGTVDAHTLIQRLYKSGKQAVLWHGHPPVTKDPDEAATPPETAGDGGKGEAAAAAEEKKPEEQEAAKEPQAETVAESSDKKPEQDVAAEKKPEKAEAGAESEKKEEEAKPSDETKKDGGESKAEAEPAKEAAAAVAKESGNDDDGAKKTKKGQAKNAGAEATTTERSLFASPAPAARYPYEEQYPYYAPQQVMSYHMTQPSASMAYYAPRPEPAYSVQQQPPQQQQQHQPMQQWSPSYLYTPYPHTTPEMPYHNDYYSSPPGMHSAPPPPMPMMHDSYRLFDDENPNACSVM